MKGKEKWLAILLLLFTDLTELHSIILKLYPETREIEFDLFWFSDYQISVYWYLKQIFDNVFLLVVFFVIIMLSNGYSKGFFQIFSINLLYQAFDFGGFLWNFKQTTYLYWAALGVVTVLELMIIFRKREGMHKV